MKQPIRIPLILFFCLFAANLSQGAERQLLTGHVPAVVATAPVVDPLTETRQLDLAIGLPWRNREALTNLLESLYNPASPQFRHYLTPAQFTAQFGPTEADYLAVIAFASSNGLKVTRTYSNRAVVDVRGSVASINKAFHVTLREYQDAAQNRTFFAPNMEPSLDLGTPVLHVSGLDNYVTPHPLYVAKPLNTNAPHGIAQAGSGPGGDYMGKDFRAAYVPGVTLDGTGQSVALFELDGYFPTDISTYENMAGLPHVPLTNVLVDVTGAPGSGTIEVSLDIEMVVSMATNLADVIVYEGVNPDDILTQMAVDDLAQQMSTSWTFAIDSTTLQTYQEFDVQGQGMFEASGDSDAYVGAPAPPTDVPYITTVGGTTLSTGVGGAYTSEVVWNSGGGLGSSGGISTTYLIPSWQKGINMSENQGSTVYRNIPDVAMVADQVFEFGNNGVQESVVGTSCAAPLWAAYTALANQLAATNGLAGVGFVNPALYGLAKSSSYDALFNDITAGNNESPSSPNRFTAATGYDLCTGWGSPKGMSFLSELALPEPLQVIPLAPPPFAGPVGGPFGPASISITLTNSKPAALSWRAGDVSAWLTLSPASGTISGDSSVIVSATLTDSATNYAAGAYTETIWFTNRTDNFAQKRTFTLLVATRPIITSQPTNDNLLQGETATFSVGTGLNAQLAYQWWKNSASNSAPLANSARIGGAAGPVLTIANVGSNDVASYFVVVSNAAGMIASSNALLTLVPSAPVVYQPPSDTIVLPGQIATFSAAVVGTLPLTYQWQFKGTNLFSFDGISGATSRSLSVSNVTPGWTGKFTLLVSNALGTNSTSANLTVLPVTASSASLTILSSFSGGSGGQNPYGGLMTNRNLPTVFFGTTFQGGSSGAGTIFRMTTNGASTPVTSFTSLNGAGPYAGLYLGSDNSLYGVTSSGGADDDGTIFRVSSTGLLTSLESFTGVSGTLPVGGLFQAKDGAFYGTSLEGGIFGDGNVFRITPSGVFSNLASFDGINGALPSGSLVEDASSNLWGTSEGGGFYDFGAIFKLTPAGQMQAQISFDGEDGDGPVPGLTLDAAGNLYGTTFLGGLNDDGEVFVISPDGTGEVLYDFSGPDGENPFGALVLGSDGNLYGTTENGGLFDDGTVFVISPSGTLTTLASFDGFQGAQPTGSLLEFKNAWFGTTVNGGAQGAGATFKVVVSGALQITGQPVGELADLGGTALFQVATLGSEPVNYTWLKDGTNLSNGGSVSGVGGRILTISNALPSSAGVYSVVVSNSFGAVTSAPALLQVLVSTPVIEEQPQDVTVLDGATAMFTVEAFGDFPLSYQWFRDGLPLTNGGRIGGATNSALVIRSATNSDSGVYSVVVNDDLFYQQSSNAALLVTPLTAPGYLASTIHSFGSRADGINPFAPLTEARDNFLFGTALGGGANGAGDIFRVTSVSELSIYAFTGGTDGAVPFGGLVEGLGNDANLYGTTSEGGANEEGTIYKLLPNNTVTPLYQFTGGSDGANPESTLAFGPDGNLYGTTSEGGDFGDGAIFMTTTAGNLTPLYAFEDGADGAFPVSGLTLASDGNFYGCAYQGGTNSFGTIYRIDTNGNFTLMHAFSGADGAYPVASLVQGTDGKLYGTAFEGGAGGFGVVFSMDTNGVFTNIYSFNYTDGGLVNAGLTPIKGGAFLGAVQNGGPGGAGGIFKITTTGVWTPVIWFNGANGAFPQQAPTLASDGYYYGATYYGGTNDDGLVYRFTLPTPPDITAQPQDIFALAGSTTNFSVTATSTSPLTCQWFFDGAAVAGATNSALTLTNITETNAGTYFVALSNAGGSVSSDDVFLETVSPPLVDNGGFELGNFTGWTLSGNTSGTVVESDTVHSGTYGAALAIIGSPGYLSQTVTTAPGAPYSLSFWVYSAPGAGNAILLATWDGATIFDQSAFVTSGWSNLQFTVTATNAASTFAIGAVGSIGAYVALDDVSLTRIPTLESTDVTETPGQAPQITLHWNVTIGAQYQVQVKGALGSGAWSNLGPPVVTGPGGLDVSDFATNAQRFYRLILLP